MVTRARDKLFTHSFAFHQPGWNISIPAVLGAWSGSGPGGDLREGKRSLFQVELLARLTWLRVTSGNRRP